MDVEEALIAYDAGEVTGYSVVLQLAFCDSKYSADSSVHPKGEFNWVCIAPSIQSEQSCSGVNLFWLSHERRTSSQNRPDALQFVNVWKFLYRKEL